MYFNGVCHLCGKTIYGEEEYKRPDNCVCEIIVCTECNKKAMDLIQQANEQIKKSKKNRRHNRS